MISFLKDLYSGSAFFPQENNKITHIEININFLIIYIFLYFNIIFLILSKDVPP